jgi:hypothetical protein
MSVVVILLFDQLSFMVLSGENGYFVKSHAS